MKITELRYRDFSLDFHQRMGKRGKPIVGQMELTFRCNLKCVHCYVADDKTKEELTFPEIEHGRKAFKHQIVYGAGTLGAARYQQRGGQE